MDRGLHPHDDDRPGERDAKRRRPNSAGPYGPPGMGMGMGGDMFGGGGGMVMGGRGGGGFGMPLMGGGLPGSGPPPPMGPGFRGLPSLGPGMGGGPGFGLGPGPGPMGGLPGMRHGPGPGPLRPPAFGSGGRQNGSSGGRGGGRQGPGSGAGGGGRDKAAATGPSRADANDYSQHFVDTGWRPQNFLRDAHMTDIDRYAEYPKLRDLVAAKDAQVRMFATPPYFMKADLKTLKLDVDTFGTKFDVVLIDPPWEEYARRAPGAPGLDDAWPWQDIQALDIAAVADTPSFVFLWCGSAEGLDAGRHCFRKWGFRRCEDICWIKTNKDPNRKYILQQDTHACLVHTKEHCLMGVRGNVRRSVDGHIIHTNVDTDVIISDEPEYGSTAKPEEMYAVVEHFSLGRRRLELFGKDRNIRAGWVTVGSELTSSNFDPQVYASHFRMPNGMPFVSAGGAKVPPGAPTLVPPTELIEELRPRSPGNGH